MDLFLFAHEASRFEAEFPESQFEQAGSLRILKTTGCPALIGQHICSIYDRRPLDCAIYPLSIVLENGQYWWIVDTSCPAASAVSDQDVRNAQVTIAKVMATDKRQIDEFARAVSSRVFHKPFSNWEKLCAAKF